MKVELRIIEDTTGRAINEVLKTMSRAESSALRKGANVMKKAVRDAARKTGVAMTKRSPKYEDCLIDAIRSSKVKDGSTTVHIMGTNAKDSGTFRTRFFEGGTKVRKQTKINGKPLAKPRDIGKIDAKPFFNPAISSSEAPAIAAMDAQLSKYIENAWNRA